MTVENVEEVILTQEDWEERNEKKLGFFPDGRKLKILGAKANDGGCSYYRMINPLEKLQELYPNIVEIRLDQNPLGMDTSGKWEPDFKFENMYWADVIFTQNISNFGGNYTARIIGKGKEFGKFVHFDTDDLLTELYDGHRLQGVYKDRGLGDITKWMYYNSDLVTVTQRKFARRIEMHCSKTLAIVKNAIDYRLPCWNAPKSKSPRKNMVRVGWAAGIHHEEDVKEFAGIPGMVNARVGRENVHWGFYGEPSQPKDQRDWQYEVWVNYKKSLLRGFRGQKNYEIYPAMPSDGYGLMIANMDIAIAPLQMNEFNDSKSEIKVAECGRYKVPLIASDVGCYDETIYNGKTGYLISPGAPSKEWVRVLTKVIKDRNLRIQMGENLHEITEEHFDLNKVCRHRLDLYKACMQKEGFYGNKDN